MLRGRDKVIIDAEKLPGRRHLFVLDPDLVRPALMLPPDRERPPPHEGP